jgi:hypothetical protein
VPPFLRALLLLVVLLAACGESRPSDLGADCYANSDCESGICGADGCTIECRSDADCGDLACTVEAGGVGQCAPACPADVYDHVCQGGRQVSCAVADDSDCETCGCGDGLRCDADDGCVALSGVGGECSSDADCNTLNCSPYTQTCRVPVGAACSTSDCDRCITGPNGYSFCSRECGTGFEGCHDNAWCLAPSGTTDYVCKPKCNTWPTDPSCPGQCWVSTGGAAYCDCPDCPVQYAPRDLGDGCDFAVQCASGTCYEREAYGANSRERAGVCSRACSSDAECGSGARCVDVPCHAGDIEGSCGALCLAACDRDSYPECQGNATCQTRQPLDGSAAVEVCDVRGQAGAICDAPHHCASGRCVANQCTPPGGAGNGSSCGVGADCQSGSCVSGVCRGTSVIGGSCSIAADCAVGTCCGDTCRAGC